MEIFHSILLVLVTASVLKEAFSNDLHHSANKKEQLERSQRHLQETNRYIFNKSPDFPCGQPIPGNVTSCQSFSKLQYPKCQSFPGKPRRVEVHTIYNLTNPNLSVEWDAPSIGFNDLWGFQVHIIDLTITHPSFNCKQINIKAKRFSIPLRGLSYGSNYQIIVQSMPPDGNRSRVLRKVDIPDKCNIPAFRLALMHFCCQFSKVQFQVNNSIIHDAATIAINITWKLKCNGVEEFNLMWNTTDQYEKCSGIVNTTDSTYTIMLPKTCTDKQYNYTAQVYGRTQGIKTETYKFWFAIPSKSSSATSIVPTSKPQTGSTDIKIIAAVVSIGILFGIFLVVILFVFFRQRSAPVILRVDDNVPLPDTEEEQSLPDSIHVLILYANCCMPCKKVIYSLWDVLNCTKLFNIHIDMLSEPKLNENPLRWYEMQVKEADRIILVTSKLMMTADMNAVTQTDNSDYVSIVHQLNLLRGELSNTTDLSKFVPVYMSYNGSKQDVPRFLSMCRTYKLAPELDKLMVHLVGMSSVQKYSKRPILEIGSGSLSFSEKKAALEKAITDAEHFHNHALSQCPDKQSNHIV